MEPEQEEPPKTDKTSKQHKKHKKKNKTKGNDDFNNWIAQDPTDVEIWYPKLKDFTFNTKFIELSHEAALALIAFHGGDANKHQLDIVKGLEDKIEEVIQSFSNHAAFVRLSTLSPKDATKTQYEKLTNLIKQELQHVPEGDASLEIRAVNSALYLACKTHSGEEAINLFKNSDRVAKHLAHRTGQTLPDQWNMNIVVREWNDINPEWEFRCFVHNHRITAITHYYKILYVEEIAICRDKIVEIIKDYFYNTLAEHIPESLSSFAIDLAISFPPFHIPKFKLPPKTLRNFTNDPIKVVVIELNPWSEATSPGLFNWKEDHQLMFGEKGMEVEMRILEKPLGQPASEVLGGMLGIMLAVSRGKNGKSEEVENPRKAVVEGFMDKEYGKKRKWKSLLKGVVSSYTAITNINFETVFNLAILDNGIVYWVFTDALCHALGTKKIYSAGTSDYEFPTLYVCCLYEIHREALQNQPQRPQWDLLAMRAAAFLLRVDQHKPVASEADREGLLIAASNVCLSLKNEMNLITKK
eukprot:TRINITY_DN19952_c0_g1_i1.p1 TRINITY_DN19952_c0_g1~~TRINITY_DN19952_c0_g1_i1.p1  ORF type:complete len:526 (+),score=145.96 TRINITY_DN19952_c0_g1_i1:86-1663(+)